jgi:hypothetical protein
MRKICCAVLLLALFATTACTIAPEKAKPAWDSATSAEQYERLFWDSVKAKNWRDVEAHLSGTMVSEAPNVVQGKDGTMDHIRKFDLTDYSLGEVKTETAGGDLIVTYTITVHGNFDGHPLPDHAMRMMSVWQQAKKGMVMVAHVSMPSA